MIPGSPTVLLTILQYSMKQKSNFCKSKLLKSWPCENMHVMPMNAQKVSHQTGSTIPPIAKLLHNHRISSPTVICAEYDPDEWARGHVGSHH